jgi:SAM-dependent methyltransferase
MEAERDLMEQFMEENRALWDALVPIHHRSQFYHVAAFLAGKSSLHHVERDEIGDVAGLRLLHLQCHFGMDTLSWERLGAQVVGVDYSPRAIELACSLRDRLGLSARFIQSNIYDLPHVLDGKFDLVYTSYGVLCWLPDLPRWGELIAGLLEPGGRFYMVEGHPILGVFSNESRERDLRVAYSYFHQAQPTRWEDTGDYADPEAHTGLPSYEWNHSLADVFNGLTGAGLRVEYLHEFPFCMYPFFPFMERREDRYWQLPGGQERIPMLFSLSARKPA